VIDSNCEFDSVDDVKYIFAKSIPLLYGEPDGILLNPELVPAEYLKPCTNSESVITANPLS